MEKAREIPFAIARLLSWFERGTPMLTFYRIPQPTSILIRVGTSEWQNLCCILLLHTSAPTQRREAKGCSGL